MAFVAEGDNGPPFSTVLATTTRSARRQLEKGVPARTPNFCKVSSTTPRGARSKSSAKSVSRILNAAGPPEPELSLSCICENRSSTSRCKSWVSSRVALIAALVSFRSGAFHPETQTGESIVTVPVGSATSKIPERASRMERINT